MGSSPVRSRSAVQWGGKVTGAQTGSDGRGLVLDVLTDAPSLSPARLEAVRLPGGGARITVEPPPDRLDQGNARLLGRLLPHT